MNTFTKRSLATAAVTGLVVVGAAPAATADDSRQQDRQESVLGGPIEIGGIDIGSQQDSGSSSSASSTESDEDGTEARSSEERDSSSTYAGLGVGGPSIDPRGRFLSQGSSTSEDDGEDTTSQRDTDLAGSLGIESEGVSGFVEQDSSSSESDASLDRDEDAVEADRSSSEQDRSVRGGFDTGGVTIQPDGRLSTGSDSTSADDGDERIDQRRSVLDLGAPFSYEGGTYVLDFFSADQEESASAEADEDGTETEQSSSEDERSDTFGGSVEGGQGDPGLLLDSEDLEVQDD